MCTHELTWKHQGVSLWLAMFVKLLHLHADGGGVIGADSDPTRITGDCQAVCVGVAAPKHHL